MYFFSLLSTGPFPSDLKMRLRPGAKADQAPCNLTVFKGAKNGAFSAEFIRFISANPFTMWFYRWLLTAGHPEEHLTSTLGTLTLKKVQGEKGRWKIWQRHDQGVRNQDFTMIANHSW